DATLITNPDGPTDAIVQQVDGKLVVAGIFGAIGGVERSFIARLHADGSFDAGFDPGVAGKVSALLVQPDGKLVVGGQFGSVGGSPINYLARLNADGSRDTGFDPA